MFKEGKEICDRCESEDIGLGYMNATIYPQGKFIGTPSKIQYHICRKCGLIVSMEVKDGSIFPVDGDKPIHSL